MRALTITAALAALALTGCGDKGVGFGPGTYGPGPKAQSTDSARTDFSLGGLEQLPRYVYLNRPDSSPAAAINMGAPELRQAVNNLQVTVDGNTYGMRLVEIDGKAYAVAEGAEPVASLPKVIAARTGCLVNPQPLRSKDASVFTLNCK